MTARDPRDTENARQGARPHVRGLATAMIAGAQVDLTDEHPNTLRHLALTLSLLVGMRLITAAPTPADRCAWRVECGVLTFTPSAQADWLDTHVARLVSVAAACPAGQRETWYDLWDVTPPNLVLPAVTTAAALLHTPLSTTQPPM